MAYSRFHIPHSPLGRSVIKRLGNNQDRVLPVPTGDESQGSSQAPGDGAQAGEGHQLGPRGLGVREGVGERVQAGELGRQGATEGADDGVTGYPEIAELDGANAALRTFGVDLEMAQGTEGTLVERGSGYRCRAHE